jgi:hypothetical protein
MLSIDVGWRLMCSFAVSCAVNGISVAIVTVVILAWNSCRPAAGQG